MIIIFQYWIIYCWSRNLYSLSRILSPGEEALATDDESYDWGEVFNDSTESYEAGTETYGTGTEEFTGGESFIASIYFLQVLLSLFLGLRMICPIIYLCLVTPKFFVTKICNFPCSINISSAFLLSLLCFFLDFASFIFIPYYIKK